MNIKVLLFSMHPAKSLLKGVLQHHIFEIKKDHQKHGLKGCDFPRTSLLIKHMLTRLAVGFGMESTPFSIMRIHPKAAINHFYDQFSVVPPLKTRFSKRYMDNYE